METGGMDGTRRGFFGSLFDLSFRHLVTGRVVKFLYVLSVIFVVLNALFTAGYASALLGVFVAATADSDGAGLVTGVLLFVVTAPLLTLFSIVYVRVFLEIVMVLFRISENTSEMTRALANLDRTRETPRV